MIAIEQERPHMTKARTVGQKRDAKRGRPAHSEPPPQRAPKEIFGPTEEAKRHGTYTAGDGAIVVYTNQHPNLLSKLRGHGSITPRQWAAGYQFEKTYAAVWGPASPSRDSTIPPLGGTAHETEAQAERWARASARTNTVLNRIGPRRYSLLVSVVCFGMGLGGRDQGRNAINYTLLREALDACAIVYGVDA